MKVTVTVSSKTANSENCKWFLGKVAGRFIDTTRILKSDYVVQKNETIFIIELESDCSECYNLIKFLEDVSVTLVTGKFISEDTKFATQYINDIRFGSFHYKVDDNSFNANEPESLQQYIKVLCFMNSTLRRKVDALNYHSSKINAKAVEYDDLIVTMLQQIEDIGQKVFGSEYNSLKYEKVVH